MVVNSDSDMARTNMTTLVEMIAPTCHSGEALSRKGGRG